MRLIRPLAAALAFTAAALVTPLASAVTVTVADPEWLDRPTSTSNLEDNDIGQADCLADATLRFDVSIAGYEQGNLYQVWSGSSCEAKESRVGTNASCVQVATQTIATVGDVTISVRDMVQRAGDSAGIGTGTAETCRNSDTPGAKEWQLHFLVINQSTEETIATAGKWPFEFDLTPPSAPTNVTAEPSENAIAIDFDVVSGEDANRVRFYCSPVAEGAAAADCSSSVLTAGETPPVSAACGTTSITGSSSGETSQTLTNDVRYAVGVAAEDKFGNIGNLSNLACATPVDITGYFEAYDAAGGLAGGGFCAFAPARGGGAVPLGLGLLVALGAVLRRRR